jgi:cytochrome c oxidase subunit 2
MAKAGENLFLQKGCLACHMAAPGSLGPNLAGVFGKERKFQDGSTAAGDEAYIRNSILNPLSQVVEGYQPVMPTFQGQLSEQELMQLIQYVKSLGQAAGGEAAPAAEGAGSTAAGEES